MGLRRAMGLVVLVLVVVSGLGMYRHSAAVAAVRVEPLPNTPKVKDGVGGKPDWRLDLLVDNKWIELGVFRDTELGEGLEWEVNEPVPLRKLLSVRVVEDDAARDDVLEERPRAGREFEGATFRYFLTTERSAQAGVDWFFDTPQGMLTALGIFVSVLLATLKLDLS